MAVTRGKAQSSLEFLVMVTFLLMIFALFYGSLVSRNSQLAEDRRAMQALLAAEDAAYEINTAIIEGHGYAKNFTLPADLYGENYSITVEPGLVFVDWAQNSRFASVMLADSSCALHPGTNSIENVEGAVLCNEVVG